VVALGPSTGPGSAREDAFRLARAVYASSLRPPALDELHARILAGDPAPTVTTTANRELAELRASITGTDAASRRLLGSIGRDINARAILVVAQTAAPPDNAPSRAVDADAGAGPPASAGVIEARLFDVDGGDFDAARYTPEAGSESPWQATVQSVLVRYPPPASPARASAVPPPASPAMGATGGDEPKERKPFYLSPWFWGAVGGAVLVGGLVYFAAKDTTSEPIHLQMRVPH
jgi:hypothetical protein